MKYRHEWKQEINYADMLTLRMRLSAIMNRDEHSLKGSYSVKSLYFDTPDDKALREKINGVNIREKFRLRYYDGDSSVIFLEKKSKINGLCLKQRCSVSAEEVRKLIYGDISWMPKSGRPLCMELYSKMQTQLLAPKTIVDYTREAFTYPAGNVRITLDYNIRTGCSRRDFLDPQVLTVPAGDSPIILEIKWDEFLPDVIRDAVAIPGRRVSACAKYAQCRIYG